MYVVFLYVSFDREGLHLQHEHGCYAGKCIHVCNWEWFGPIHLLSPLMHGTDSCNAVAASSLAKFQLR